PLLYETDANAVSTVSLLAQKEGYLELDPQSGIRAADWQNPGQAFLLQGAQPLLRYRRPVTETQAAALRELIQQLKAVQARYDGQDARLVPLKTQLMQKEAVIAEIVKNYEAEQQEQVFGTLRAPFKKGEAGWILPGKRALGTAASGTVLARFHSQNRLSVRLALPLNVWRHYDLMALNARVVLQGREAAARVVHQTLEPRLDGQLLLTLELLSRDPIFTWDARAQGPAAVQVRLELPPKKESVTYSSRFTPQEFTRSYAEMGERVRFPVNPTGALGRTQFVREEGEWVRSKERVGGIRPEDQALLKTVLALTESFQNQVTGYLAQLRQVRGPFAPAELTRFEQTLAQIKTLQGYQGIWDYEAPQTGILTGTLDAEAQAFHDRPVAEVLTPQIYLRHRIEKRIQVKPGDIVIVRRAASGEETLGIARQVKRELTDQSRGEDQSRFQEISIEVRNEPAFWLGDHEYGVEVFYAVQAETQTRLQEIYREREERLNQFYAETQGALFPAQPLEFVAPGVESDRQLLIHLLEKSGAAGTQEEARVFKGLAPELAQEQSGEIDPNLKLSSNPEINRILRESNGDQRRQWLSLFLQNPSLPVSDIEHLVFYGSSDVSQLSLDYLLRQRRIVDLMAVHAALYQKNPDLDKTKLARAHIVELLESDEDPLKRLVQLDHADAKRTLAETFLASLLIGEQAAFDADHAVAVRKVLASPFWRTYADKLSLAQALEKSAADPGLQSRGQKAATLVRNQVFADIALNIRWVQGEPQEHAKGAGAVQRYDTATWDQLQIAKHTDEQDRLRLQLPWVIVDDVPPEENFKGRINAELYEKALAVYRGFQTDAAAVKTPSLNVLDFEPGTGGFYSDHVFNRLDVLTRRNDYLQHLSLHALERLLEMGERPENVGYRERREQIVDRLVKDNSAQSRLILARALVKTQEPEVLQLLLTKDVSRLLIEDMPHLKETAAEAPGTLLLYQQALAKLSGRVEETEGQRRLALRVLLDTLSDFDLKDLAKGNHPIQKMLESAGIPEAVI
ncbi:MAG: hypothetical protein KBC91_07950, partial [Candidatus Omnitrophica bacterium]|nr:hypothetical protein [Candidatus Omnitrophota bacterium]